MTAEEAEDYQPFVEQAGTQANFPGAFGASPFALSGNVVRYLAIGGMPLNPLLPTLNCRSGQRSLRSAKVPK